MKPLRRILPALLLLAATVAGCSDSTGPSEVLVGTWEVQEIEGNDVPFSDTFEVFPGVECTGTITSIDITFTASGSVTVADRSSITCAGEPTEDTSETRTGSYTVSGDRVTTTFTDAGETETEINRFTVSGNTLELFEGTSSGGARVVLATRR